MTKKRWAILLVCLLCTASAAYLWLLKIYQKDPLIKISHLKRKVGSYFIPIDISERDQYAIPYIPTQIENQTIFLAIDLGCSSNICLPSKVLNSIQEKTYLHMRKSYGMRGKSYEKLIYSVPKLEIGTLVFQNLLIDEESEDFQRDALILKEKESYSPLETGRIGWKLFKNTNLLLDLGNSRIVFCDSLDTLKKNGYPIRSFTKTPLFFDHHILQFEANTPEGPIRCWLDTGATWNILNIEGKGKTPEQLAWDTDSFKDISKFVIDQSDFGPIQFRKLPIRFPFQVEAILGMEFFNHHVVFLDFNEHYVYFLRK